MCIISFIIPTLILSHTDLKDFKDGYAVRYAVMLANGLFYCVAAKRRNNLLDL